MNIIYFNGDSFIDHRYFREEAYNILSIRNRLIINNAISGNWNTNIVKQSINELTLLDKIAEKTNSKVNAFIFLSELLRDEFEIKILANIVKIHSLSDNLESALAKLAEFYYSAILDKVSKLKNVNVQVSSAFTDLHIDTKLRPMYATAIGSKVKDVCYTVSYLSKFGDNDLLNMGFSKIEIEKLIDTINKRRVLLESIPNSDCAHLNDRQQYKLIINSVKNLI